MPFLFDCSLVAVRRPCVFLFLGFFFFFKDHSTGERLYCWNIQTDSELLYKSVYLGFFCVCGFSFSFLLFIWSSHSLSCLCFSCVEFFSFDFSKHDFMCFNCGELFLHLLDGTTHSTSFSFSLKNFCQVSLILSRVLRPGMYDVC